MNWSDYEFILESDEDVLPEVDMTGWESVVFEVEDEPAPAD